MKLHELKPAQGAKHRKKLLGRGEGSGHGGSATKGMKGQTARSGTSRMIGFEGGQMPLYRRIPKRGFNSRKKINYAAVNISDINNVFNNNDEITPDLMIQKGLARKNSLIKILGEGEITKPVTIKASGFSKSAEKKILAAGGKVEKIS